MQGVIILASIVKRNKSYAVVHYVSVDGIRKQRWETYHSFEEASRRKSLLELCQKTKYEQTTRKAMTVTQFLQEYIRLYGFTRWSASTYQSNVGLIQNYILPAMGSMYLSELTPRVVAELYHQFLSLPKLDTIYHKSYGRTITACTLKSIHKVLHSAFEQAVLWEYVVSNPFHRAALPKTHINHRQFLTPEQIELLLKQCSNRILSLAIHIAFAGSLRRGELLALTWQDVNFEQSFIRITKTVSRINREALVCLNQQMVFYQFPSRIKKSRTVVIIKRPKTESSIRTVYLPQTVMRELHSYQQEQAEKLPSREPNQPDLIFRCKNGQPVLGDILCHWFHKELEAARLPPVVFHSLRHSSISYKLVLSEGDIKAVQADSGHAQSDMVTDLYGHALDRTRRINAHRFEQAFYGE